MATAFPLGAHQALRAGDVIEVRCHGPLTLDDAVVLHDRLAQMYEELGSGFLLCDLGDVSSLDADARRYMAEWNRTHVLSGAALYGANFTMRTIAGLAVKAIRLMGNRQTEVVFLRDEAEGRRWISARRLALTRRGPA